MTQDNCIALFTQVELIAALRANDPHMFRRWLQMVNIQAQLVRIGVSSFSELII